MFPLQRGNELVIQFSNSSNTPHQQSKISQDPILNDYASPRVGNSDKRIAKTSTGNKLSHASKKKMMHREIERQRRQEMATLYASLRSLLPLEYIKGKRSISDHMSEAVTYIKQLQKKIKELGAKRDELRKHLDSHNLETPEGEHKSISLTVHGNNGAVGVEIISNLKNERFLLSKLLEFLIEEGLEVVTCLSTQVNGRLLHSVHCEVNNSTSVDLSELRRKVANFIT